MWGDGQIHNYWCIADHTHRMCFVRDCETKLTGLNGPDITLDLKLGGPLEDQEDFVAQVVAVSGIESLPRFHLQDARAHLWRDEEVLYVFRVSVVVNGERHGNLLGVLYPFRQKAEGDGN